MLSDVGGVGGSECSGRPIFIPFITENMICAMMTHHDQPSIKILLTRNLLFDSRQIQKPSFNLNDTIALFMD